jgi:hypothetical protein
MVSLAGHFVLTETHCLDKTAVMLTAEALVETKHPARYLIQLGRHASQMTKHRLHRPRHHTPGKDRPARQARRALAADGDRLTWSVNLSPFGKKDFANRAAAGNKSVRILIMTSVNVMRLMRRVSLERMSEGYGWSRLSSWANGTSPFITGCSGRLTTR